MSERLYNLLPEIYRTLDYQRDEPLRALMKVLESEFDFVSEDISNLYRNWFIETCDEWVVPYIADLLSVKGIRADGNVSLRAFVANTIAYRRRKGTAQVIEEIARDLLNHPTRAQEFEFLLCHTQHMNHLRMKRKATMEVRSPDICRQVDTAFDQSMHIAEVGLIRSGQGHFNLPNVGVSVWRIESNSVSKSDAAKIGANRFTFDPFGRDLPIYNIQRTQLDAFQPVTEADVVEPISRRVLENELNAIRSGTADTDGVYFGSQPVLEIFLDGSQTPVEPRHIFAADLSIWRAPAPPANPGDPILVAVDPALGRIATQQGRINTIKVSYSYGTPGNIGGGYRPPKESQAKCDCESSETVPESPIARQVEYVVSSIVEIQQVFLLWDSVNFPQLKLVLDTNDTLTGDITIEGFNTDVTLVAGEDRRPSLIGNIIISPGSCPDSVTIQGLWIKGQIRTPKPLRSLNLTDTTILVTNAASILTADDSEDLEIDIRRCKLGACHLDKNVVRASVTDSVIHHLDGVSIADRLGNYGPPLTLIRCTLFGSVKAKQIDLCSESIVIGVITAERTQVGCVRFSWLPLVSRVPRRFYCQPNLEADLLKEKNPSWTKAQVDERATVATYPRFESKNPHSVAYAQLGRGCPKAVAHGAEDEGEMGVWHFLYEQERISNFFNTLDEYLRFGLDAGLIKRT